MSTVLEGHLDNLEYLLKYRSQDLLDSRQRNDLNSSHSALTLACEMIIAATKVLLSFKRIIACVRGERASMLELRLNALLCVLS